MQHLRTTMTIVMTAVVVAAAALGAPACSTTPSKAGAPAALDSTRSEAMRPTYPETRRQDLVETVHGQPVADPYRWLEDEDAPEVQAWMDAQNAVTRGYLHDLPARDRLAERFAELYYVDRISAPTRRGSRLFWAERDAKQEKWVYYWREGEAGEQRVLLDPNTMSEDGSISVGRVVPSHDGARVAYTLKENNADESTLYVMDVGSGVTSEIDVIPGAKYADPSWTPDGSGFYYTWLPTDASIPVADRPGHAEVRFHELGADPAKDRTVVEALGDPTKFHGVDLSRDGEHLIYVVQHGWASTDLYHRNLAKGEDKWRPLVEGRPYLYSAEVWDGQIYITTNEGAPRFRVLRASTDAPARESWEEIVAEMADGAVIDNAQIIGGRLVLTLLNDVRSDLRIHALDGELLRDIELPGIGATGGMTGNPDHDTAYFGFQSFTMPPRIYETKISTGASDLWAEVEVPIDPSPYEVEQVWYTSKDGTKVPMFIVRKKGAPKDGSTPTLLYGYGGFNVSMHPYFRASIYPWLEAGGAYAVPNLRGGGEFGEDWHKAGMLDQKQNVFDDFIAAAEYLVEEGYTSPEKLAIRGGSNGGLLVGAAMTQRPDLFGAVICSVPLLDMVRYHLFGSGKTWISEYGSAEDAALFEVLHGYSPYHRVEEGTDYPALLMLAADSDDRVDPMHARKFTAAIQHASSSAHPALLRIERNAGHGGADLVKRYVAQDADVYAFLMSELGLSSSPPAEPAEPAAGSASD